MVVVGVVMVVVVVVIVMMMTIMTIVLTPYCDMYLGLTGEIFPSALPIKTLYLFLVPSMNTIVIGTHTECAQMQSSI